MKKITINGESFEFTSDILMKHLRKIQPITKKMEAGDIGELDFFIYIAVILCESDNKDILEEKIDSLDLKGIEEFTEDFKPILEQLNNFHKDNENNKKK